MEILNLVLLAEIKILASKSPTSPRKNAIAVNILNIFEKLFFGRGFYSRRRNHNKLLAIVTKSGDTILI